MQQPVSIAIQADQKEFQLYQSGVFTGSCGVELDHGVLVVGYGSENGDDYYLVKNSWSTSWGDNGYITISRGLNTCRVSDYVYYPVMRASDEPTNEPPTFVPTPGPSEELDL